MAENQEWEQSEEDRIIAMLQDTRATNYCDPVFTADPSSLYRDPELAPDYDKGSGAIRWVRGMDYASNPDYLKDDASGVVVNGRMDDLWLVSAMAAVAAHPIDPNNIEDGGSLIETLFGSSPDDFKDFGVYTARIYKNGQWVEVVCDTRMPCAPPTKSVVVPGLKSSTSLVPIGCRAEDANEQWVPFLEKAFAKFHGSYESLNSGCIGEGLVDLTGGSVETIVLGSPAAKALIDGPGGRMWTMIKAYVEDKYSIVCAAMSTAEEDRREAEKMVPPAPEAPPGGPRSPSAMKRIGSTNSFQRQNSLSSMNITTPTTPMSGAAANLAFDKAAGIMPGTSGIEAGAGLSVLKALRVGKFDLVQLKNPLPSGGFSWTGSWGRRAEEWAEFPEIAEELADYGGVPVTRVNDDTTVGSIIDDGTFWMAAQEFMALFSKIHVCRVFPDNRFKQFCIHGEWDADTSGGGLRIHPDDADSSAAMQIEYHNKYSPCFTYPPLSLSVSFLITLWGNGHFFRTRSLLDLNLCESYALRANPEVLVRPAANPSASSSWFKNPQYSITVPAGAHNVKVHISLLQHDRRTKNKLNENLALGFTVLRRKPGIVSRCWDVMKSSEVLFDSTKSPLINSGTGWAAAGHASKEVETMDHDATREICGDVVFEPGCSYLIVPHTEKQGACAKYVLRLFTPVHSELNISMIPKISTLKLESGWVRGDVESCGGPLLTVQDKPNVKPEESKDQSEGEERPHDVILAANPKWCENPQFLLRMPHGVPQAAIARVTFVVKRTDLTPKVVRGHGRKGQAQPDRLKYDDRAPGVGMLICKVSASEDPADRRRRDKAEAAERTDALGEALPTKESSLRHKPRTVYLAEAREAAAMSESGNELPVERKMAVSSKEWHMMSDLSNRVVSHISMPMFSSSFAPDGLIIVPSLSVAGTPGTFSLEVHSDTPGLRLDAMPAGRSKTIAGEWIQATAGGSHINTGTWKRNPRFHLKVLGGRTKLKITLTRPASVWKSQVNKDSLGCMIGFYVCKGPITNRDLSGNILYEDEPWSETPFVPTHSVSTPVNFELPPLEDEVYSIIPATFDADKLGPFVLSVTADSEVHLSRDTGKVEKPAVKVAGGMGAFAGRFARK